MIERYVIGDDDDFFVVSAPALNFDDVFPNRFEDSKSLRIQQKGMQIRDCAILFCRR